MATFVTLGQAKAHLRVETDTENDDIYQKLVQASGIVADYLKARFISIASIAAANPAVVTTVTPHSLVTGTTYTIGGTTTTPTVNGSQVVTVTGSTTFTVPVNVTSGQAAAAGTVGSPAWTEVTAPAHVQAATLVMLAHLYEHRGDDMEKTDEALWEAMGRLLVRSRDPALA
jgi:hypothetical protein